MSHYQSNITAYLFGPDREPRAISLPHLASSVSSEKSLVWVDFSDYSTKDLLQAAEYLHLPPAAVHATLYGWQRPQLEVFDEQFFLIVAFPKRDTRSSRIQVQHLYLFIGHNFVVSAHEKPLPFFERVLRRAMHTSSLLSHDSVFMLSLILNELVASYEDLDEQLQQEIEELQQRAFTDPSDTNLRDLYHFKRYAFAMSQLINQHQEVLAALLRSDICSMSGQQVEVSYCNLEARLFRLADVLFTARDSMKRAIHISVLQTSHRINHLVKILLIVSTVLLPTLIILGFPSKNTIEALSILTPSMDFVLLVTNTLLVGAVMLWIFHHKD